MTWDDDPGHEERQVAVARAIAETVNLGPRMSAVDIGGGTGRLSILLADRVGSVVVTDPSAGMVQVARERIGRKGSVTGCAPSRQTSPQIGSRGPTYRRSQRPCRFYVPMRTVGV